MNTNIAPRVFLGPPRARCATLILQAFAAGLPLAWIVAAGAATPEPVLFRETFDDAKLQSRGWYDVSKVRLAGQSAAGQGCIQYEWTDAQSGVRGSSPARHLFEPTDEMAIRFYLKLSKGWGWSGQNYHPHLTRYTNVVLRSPDFPKMKFNQFLMAPYFGPGLLPHAQRLWIDELAVGTKRIGPLANPSPSARQGATSVRGLAAAYPGDVEIEQDPAVVFVESFEGTGSK